MLSIKNQLFRPCFYAASLFLSYCQPWSCAVYADSQNPQAQIADRGRGDWGGDRSFDRQGDYYRGEGDRQGDYHRPEEYHGEGEYHSNGEHYYHPNEGQYYYHPGANQYHMNDYHGYGEYGGYGAGAAAGYNAGAAAGAAAGAESQPLYVPVQVNQTPAGSDANNAGNGGQ